MVRKSQKKFSLSLISVRMLVEQACCLQSVPSSTDFSVSRSFMNQARLILYSWLTIMSNRCLTNVLWISTFAILQNSSFEENSVLFSQKCIYSAFYNLGNFFFEQTFFPNLLNIIHDLSMTFSKTLWKGLSNVVYESRMNTVWQPMRCQLVFLQKVSIN